VKLSELVDFNPSLRMPDTDRVPFVDMASLPQHSRDIISFELRAPSSSGARFMNGDTLIARITPCLENGKGAQVRILTPKQIGQGSTEFIVMRAKHPSDRDFVYYLSRHPVFRSFAIKQMTGTSGRQRVAWQSLTDFEFKEIQLEERRAVAAVLAALDDKIELNRRMNETLEAMARAIFRDWFVTFGPTRAKMAQRGEAPSNSKAGGEDPQKENVARAPYLAPDIWSLFPDALDEDGKPEGWNSGTLAEVANLNPESWSRANYPDSVEYVDLSNTKWGTIEAITSCSNETAPSRAQRILRPGDTIVGTVRPGNGSYAYVSAEGFTGSTGFAVLRPKRSIFREVVYLASTSGENIDRLAHLADGGAYPAVRPEIVSATEFVSAPERLIAEFSSSTSALIDRAEANKREIETLAATRDLLLPKLMSGEVRVSDAEKIAGEVA